MEQGRVRKYSRRERQGVTDQECGTKDTDADYREYDQRNPRSGREYAYGNADTEDYTGGTSSSRSGKCDSGIKAAWDCVANTRIRVKRNGRTVAKVPASLGLVGVVGSIFNRRLAMVGAIGLAGALSAGYCLELDSEKSH